MSTSRLAYWRTRRGLTQEQLAALAGVTQAAVSQMERAQRAPKGLYSALAFAAALRCKVTDLWPIRPQPAPQHRPAKPPGGERMRARKTAKNQGPAKG